MTNTEAVRQLQTHIRQAQTAYALSRCERDRRELAQRISAWNVALSIVAKIDRVDRAKLGY